MIERYFYCSAFPNGKSLHANGGGESTWLGFEFIFRPTSKHDEKGLGVSFAMTQF